MIGSAEFPLNLERQLCEEALAAFPRECCGLLEGVIEDTLARVTAIHSMPNVATEPDSFEIDPAGHINLLRQLRGAGRAIIGCYHSHPNGRAEPSERDRESALEADFLWLVCAVDEKTGETRIAASVSCSRSFSPVPIKHIPGTAGAQPASAKANRAAADGI